MYTKTNWVDNTTPIDKDNLNKIEQGIYDNSLVVDAVTDTLNPTDTETYKTAELTEGQITDVIGVNDIVIKGQTSQDGDPTPSSPVDVNVVSGSNDVYIGTKNKLKIPNIINKKISGVTFLLNNDGSVSISGTSTAVIDLSLDLGYTINISGEYTFSLKTTGTIAPNSSQQWILRKDTTATSFNPSVLSNATTKSTQTLTQSINNIRIYTASGTTFNCTIYPMLEQGSTDTTYEPHQGKELPLDLLVGNLAYIEEKNKYRKYSTGAFQETPYFDSYIAKVIPNVTYSTKSLSDAVDYSNLCYFDENMQYLSGEAFSTEVRTRTFTTPANCGYVTIAVPHTITQFMLVKGTAEDINPIELCKIGNYQDYFYKSGSKWYLHKETGKDVVDENNTIAITNTGTSNWYYKITPKKIAPTASQTNQICNYYPNEEIFNGNTNQGILKISNGEEIRIRYGTEDTVANFKTWLASNNIILYSLLATATNTEITDTTLISQLEAIYNAPLYEETNITQTNNDLPMILDITACKDNINGIKAFIRK